MAFNWPKIQGKYSETSVFDIVRWLEALTRLIEKSLVDNPLPFSTYFYRLLSRVFLNLQCF